MQKSDLARVIKIIDAHDDDDAEAAELDFERRGIDDQYVYQVDGTVIGITGFRRVDGTDKTAWISWTYLEPSYCGKGHGKTMFKCLINILRDEEARKVFVKVSNYNDPEEGKIYERALNMYKSVGFELEVTNTDFYDEGEDQYILGKHLAPHLIDSESEVIEEKPVIRFNGLFEIAESDGAFTFSWDVLPKKALFGKRSFSVQDLYIGLGAVEEQGGRKVFITFPSNLPLIHQPLQAAGFKYVGALADYYENGVNEMHFSHDLSRLSNETA